MKFKNYIETESGIKDTSTSPGTAGQVLSSTVTGTSWIDQGEIIAAAATLVTIECKNRDVITLVKGTPVYQTGTVGATDIIEVARGSALISDGAQPSIGLLQQDLDVNEIGYVVITGGLLNITTDPIDGLTPVTGQKVFVKSGGGLTLTKPTTELNTIQNMGLVGKVSGGNAGSITVSSIMRTNDVPNLPTGRIWIGDGNTIVSDTVYVDEPNGRVGIGTTEEPNRLLTVETTGTGSYLALNSSSNNTTIGSDVNGAFIVYDDSSSTYRMVIDQTTGNMGIGTVNPQSQIGSTKTLDISSNGNGEVILDHTDAGTASDIGLYSWNRNNDHLAHIKATCDGATDAAFISFHTQATGGSFLNPSSNEKMRIESNGNVGIGTTDPGAKLEVVGESGVIIDSGTGSQAKLTLIGDAGTYGGGGIIDVIGAPSDFVGYNLNVKRSPNTMEASNEYNAFRTWSWDGNMFSIAGQPYTSYEFKSQGSSQMVIYNNNVGIGLTNPSEKLHVAGNGYFQSSLLVGSTSNIMFNYISSFVILAASGQTIALGGGPGNINNNVLIGNGNLSVSGNVGIGTTNPLAKLQVDGSANIGSLHTNFAGASYNVNLGFENYNNGFAAIATGQNTLADASVSFSMGFQSKATGVASLAGGNVNPIGALPSESAGEASIAFGNGVKTNSNANYSQAFGRGTETGGGLTSANQAMAMGFDSIAFGDNSFSGGNNSRAFGEASFAFGEGASASKGDGNIALGIGVTTPASASAANGVGQVAVGKYNVYNTGGVSHLFAVGAGTSDNSRYNAFNVTSSGRIGINGITNPSTVLHAKLNDYSTGFYMEGPSFSTSFNYMAFYGGTTFRGSINPIGSNGILYSSASDYRLKENVTKLQDSIERIKKLKPSNFNFLEDPSENVDGFIAHEVQEVVPQAVTGKKDAVGPNGDPIYQAIDQAKIVPLLTAALQESITKIEQLEQRIQTLENK